MIEYYVDLKSLFDNIVIFVSISIGLFGAFVSTVFSLKHEKKIREMIESVSYRRQLRFFLSILIILSSLIIIFSIFISSTVSTELKIIMGNCYSVLVIFSLILFVIYIVLITLFFLFSINVLSDNDS